MLSKRMVKYEEMCRKECSNLLIIKGKSIAQFVSF